VRYLFNMSSSILESLAYKLIHRRTEFIFYCKRAILFYSSSKILTPPPPLPLAPQQRQGGTHSPGGEGDGGSIFWKTREIGLPSYSKIFTLCIGVSVLSLSGESCLRKSYSLDFHVHHHTYTVTFPTQQSHDLQPGR
jgi:hypothetical protein